jgi:hypothetical protein
MKVRPRSAGSGRSRQAGYDGQEPPLAGSPDIAIAAAARPGRGPVGCGELRQLALEPPVRRLAAWPRSPRRFREPAERRRARRIVCGTGPIGEKATAPDQACLLTA